MRASSSRARCAAASRYQLILIDPPKFGRGPDGEVWDVFTHLAPLLRDCAALLAPGRAALVLTTYAIRASALAIDGLVRECLAGRPGAIESGELAVIEQSGRPAAADVALHPLDER